MLAVHAWCVYPKIVERRFRQQWPEKQPPDRHTITTCHRKLQTRSLVQKSPRGKKVTEAQVDRIQHAFQRTPSKSHRRARRELAIPKSTIHDVLHKRLRLRAYMIQLVQKLQPNDLPARYEFASDMLLKMDICRRSCLLMSPLSTSVGSSTGIIVASGDQNIRM